MFFCRYIIGGIAVEVSSDSPLSLPPSYAPFADPAGGCHHPSGALRIISGVTVAPEGDVVATGFNDLGESRLFFDGTRYTVGISPCPGEEMRYMTFSPDLRSATLTLRLNDRWASFVADSMLRIFFAQVAVLESSLLVHASAVVSAKGAHLFLGKSGTGKSTHSSLWLSNFADCSLLNDDNPLIRLSPDGSVCACGTPWSGKTPCWRNAAAPLLSMTRLRQACENRYTPLSDVEALIAVIPGISVVSHCRQLYHIALDTLAGVVEGVRVGRLDCLPNDEAALTSRHNTEPKSK